MMLTMFSDCCCLSTGVGFLPRRRIALFQLLPPCQPAHSLPARAGDRRPRGGVHYLRTAVPDQLGGRERAVLAVRGEQLRGMGHADPLPADMGQGALPSGRVLYGMAEPADCDSRRGMVGVWVGSVDVPKHGAESEWYVCRSSYGH